MELSKLVDLAGVVQPFSFAALCELQEKTQSKREDLVALLGYTGSERTLQNTWGKIRREETTPSHRDWVWCIATLKQQFPQAFKEEK